MPRKTTLVAAAAATLVAAAPAHATIVPGRSMAGVRLGMTQVRVLKILGDPTTDFTYRSGLTTYTYKKLRLRVTFAPARTTNNVFMLYTSGRKERTKEGIGVGSKESTLRRKLHGEHCLRNSNGRFCVLGGGDEGLRPETSFEIGRHHRVKSVRILRSDF
jgi:outer membrane protein assembly factor BamE (lipoprotein component of BamABCDE complex)